MKNAQIALLLMFTLQLAACNSTHVTKGDSQESRAFDSKLDTYVQQVDTDNLGGPLIQRGILAIKEGDYRSAQSAFSQALKFDPSNANLHFLNGLSYHLLAANGDSSQLPFAGTGYQLALEYDSSHYWAAYQLGHIKFQQHRYLEAQEAFSYALLLEPGNLELLSALAACSYYAQDINTGLNMIRRAMNIAPDNPMILRNAVMIFSAANLFQEAQHALSQYKSIVGQGHIGTERLSSRINAWRDFHIRNANLQLADSSAPAQAVAKVTAAKQADKKTEDIDLPKMTLVDVVIIRSEERAASSKGVNLLNGLTATLGGNTIDYNHVRPSGRGSGPSTTTITYNPTLAIAAAYSLNIFNNNDDRNEVIARPSLVALDGEKSEFYTGAVFHVELVGIAGSQGEVTDVPVGISLAVTPKFIDKETVQLEIGAERAFIESRSAQVGFNNFAQTTKTTINANVVMNFGDTLILSGLSEKEDEVLRDGVPLLENIPGIQYLFSDEDRLEFQKSVLILVTPRKPRYAYEDGTLKSGPDQSDELYQPSLEELRGRTDIFKPAHSLDAVFHHLKDRRFYKEFRTGDVKLETWRTTDGLERRIKRAIDFLYF